MAQYKDASWILILLFLLCHGFYADCASVQAAIRGRKTLGIDTKTKTKAAPVRLTASSGCYEGWNNCRNTGSREGGDGSGYDSGGYGGGGGSGGGGGGGSGGISVSPSIGIGRGWGSIGSGQAGGYGRPGYGSGGGGKGDNYGGNGP